MRKPVRMILVTILSLSVFLLSSCTGFNGIMYRDLSDESYYKTCEAKFLNAYYYDTKTRERISILSSPDTDLSDLSDILFDVTFFEYEDVRPFYGTNPDREKPLEEYIISLEVIHENLKLLMDNGFFEEVLLDETIQICASRLIYMDTNFFFIAEVTYNGKTYLDFETGFSNIIKMMDANRSLL